MSDAGGRRRGLIISAVAGLIVAAIYVVLRQRGAPELLVQSDEGWQPEARVAVGGAVVHPGMYTMRGDARLSDLVTAAGGYSENAERTALNPAARVSDGMEYIIPVQSARATPTPPRVATVALTTTVVPMTATTGVGASPSTAPARTPPSAGTSPVGGVVNINTATLAELEALPAIGPAIAQRIIDDRAANGPYTRIEDLARVRGISARTVDQLRERITVAP